MATPDDLSDAPALDGAGLPETVRATGGQVEASVRRLTLDPFRGLIARDVRIYDYKKRERTLAVVSEVALDVNYAALFHQRRSERRMENRPERNANRQTPTP